MMLGEVLVKIFRGNQLEDGVPQKLESLIGAESQIVEADASVGERSRQQSNVRELHSDRVLKLGQSLQEREGLDPLPVASDLLLLKRMRRVVHPDVEQFVLAHEQRVREHLIGDGNVPVEVQRPHEGLEAVGHSVPQFEIVAQVRAVGVQHELVELQILGEEREVLILDDGRPISGQTALLQIGEHVVQVDGGEELDDGVAEELEALVVGDVRLRLLDFAQPRHDVDERVDAALPRVHVVDATVAVLGLADAAVRERIASVVGVRAKVLAVRRVRECQLEQIAVLKAVTHSLLEHVQRFVEAQVTDQHREKHPIKNPE